MKTSTELEPYSFPYSFVSSNIPGLGPKGFSASIGHNLWSESSHAHSGVSTASACMSRDRILTWKDSINYGDKLKGLLSDLGLVSGCRRPNSGKKLPDTPATEKDNRQITAYLYSVIAINFEVRTIKLKLR